MELQMDQDPRFSFREWRVERVGWAVILALVVAALLGLFGQGPLSLAQASSPDGALLVAYGRFVRSGSSTTLGVDVGGRLVTAGRVRIGLDRAWLSEMELTSVTPEPDSVGLEGDDVVYTFAAPPAGTPLRLEFSLTVRGTGPVTGRVDAPADGDVAFWQFLYP